MSKLSLSQAQEQYLNQIDAEHIWLPKDSGDYVVVQRPDTGKWVQVFRNGNKAAVPQSPVNSPHFHRATSYKPPQVTTNPRSAHRAEEDIRTAFAGLRVPPHEPALVHVARDFRVTPAMEAAARQAAANPKPEPPQDGRHWYAVHLKGQNHRIVDGKRIRIQQAWHLYDVNAGVRSERALCGIKWPQDRTEHVGPWDGELDGPECCVTCQAIVTHGTVPRWIKPDQHPNTATQEPTMNQTTPAPNGTAPSPATDKTRATALALAEALNDVLEVLATQPLDGKATLAMMRASRALGRWDAVNS